MRSVESLADPARMWHAKSLGELGRIYGGLSGKSKEDFGNGFSKYIPFVNVIRNVRIDPNSLESVVVHPGERQNAVQFGDVIFNGSSETPEEVGFASVVDFKFDNLYLNSFCFGFRPFDPEAIDSVFLAYLFRSKVGRNIMYSLAQGSTRYNLSKPRLLAAELILPTVDEQRVISKVLTDIDSLVEALDALIEKKRAMKQGAMQQLLSGKTRLPGFEPIRAISSSSVRKMNVPSDWEVVTPLRLLRRRVGLPQSVQRSAYLEFGTVPIVDQGKQIVAGYTNDSRYVVKVPVGGLLVFGDHTRNVKWVGHDFAIGADGTQILETTGADDLRFLTYAIANQDIPNTGYNRHFKYFEELEIGVPGVVEQRAIAQVLIDLDAEIDALVVRRDKTALIKTGMMQELLTGRTRLV